MNAWQLLRDTFWRWYDAMTFRLAAALAYYTVFSLAPIVVIAVAVASFFFGHELAEKHFSEEMSAMAGDKVGSAIMDLSKSADDEGHGLLATIISVIVLLVGATTVFGQLQDALNVIWGVKPDPQRSWWLTIRDRFLSFSIVLSLGFLLLVSLAMTAVMSALSTMWTPSSLPGGAWLWMAINWLISFGLITSLFAMIYKVLPDVKIAWRDVWMGAIVTALLFNLGKYAIGLYLGHSSWISAYGAAASLVVILLWVYYSAQILMFGAQFTYVYAKSAGKPIVPARHAIPIDKDERLQSTSPVARTSGEPKPTASAPAAVTR